AREGYRQVAGDLPEVRPLADRTPDGENDGHDGRLLMFVSWENPLRLGSQPANADHGILPPRSADWVCGRSSGSESGAVAPGAETLYRPCGAAVRGTAPETLGPAAG